MIRRSFSTLLVVALCLWALPSFAEAPKAKVGQNVSVLLKGLLPRKGGDFPTGCNFPIQYQIWSKHGTKDQDPSWDEVVIYVSTDTTTLYRVVVTFDGTGDMNTFTGDGVDVYVVDDHGIIIQTMPVSEAPDDPCGLFVKHTV